MKKQTPNSKRRGTTISRFLLVQLLLLGTAAGAFAYRSSVLRERRQLPTLRSNPIQVLPEYNYDFVVSDEQLLRVLKKLVLRDQGRETKVNHIDHALRFWGVEAAFENAEVMSGEAMRDVLVDHRVFTARYGEEAPSLLTPGEHGPGVRVQKGLTSSSHVDHTLASLAEVGTPLQFPIHTPGGPTDYEAMLRESLLGFRPNQTEYEWSALAYLLYLAPARSWYTKDGLLVEFDQVAERLMRQRMPQGVCFGNHRLYTLTILLRVDDRFKVLSSDVRQSVEDYLLDMTSRLVKHQHASGYWDQGWPTTKAADAEEANLTDRLLATGHAMEWWAMAPPHLHPPRHVLAAAGQWLVQAVDNLTEEQTKANYTYLSHVGRALALWRGRFPSEFVASQTESL